MKQNKGKKSVAEKIAELGRFLDIPRTAEEIKKEIEGMFKVKVEKVRTHIRQNKKYAYVKLKDNFPAIDLATKLGLM